MESKRSKFVRLAESRMNSALKQIDLLINLSNTKTYEYDREDADLIIKTLKNAVSDLEHAYRSDSRKNKKFVLNPKK